MKENTVFMVFHSCSEIIAGLWWFVCVVWFLSPSRHSVRSATAHTAGAVPSAVSAHGAHHTLVQLPLVHAWLTHHRFLLLLIQLVLQVLVHGGGHVLYTKRYDRNTLKTCFQTQLTTQPDRANWDSDSKC